MSHKSLILVPVVIVVAALGASWYTGNQLEEQIKNGISEANIELEEDLPEIGAYITLLEFKQGVFSSTAKYSLTLTAQDPEQPKVLLFTDRLQHGPFPLSRLAAGKFAPVLAQSNFELDKNELSEPLYAAAGDKAPIFGELNMYYDQSVDGTLESAKLNIQQGPNSLNVEPAKVHYSLSSDHNNLTVNGQLASVSLDFIHTQTGHTITVQLEDLELDVDKQENAYGFPLGTGMVSLKSLRINPQDAANIEIKDAWLQETLSEENELLNQKVSYRINNLHVAGQALGALTLKMSANNLDQKTLNEIDKTLEQYIQDGISVAEEETINRLSLKLIDSHPSFSIDELSLKTQHGVASASANVTLNKPKASQAEEQDLLSTILAAATGQAKVEIDKAVLGDIAALQLLAEHGPDNLEPAQLKQQTDMLTELFSAMALGSEWAVLNGNVLSSKIDYADNQVTLNGKTMSVEEFMQFVSGQ
jgi:uncharacterized protein YdgA (DUF945 family)